MVATGFSNSFTSGEISDDAWDRTDIQPVAKGCEEATNLLIRIAGPLGKRRGFWRIADVVDQAKTGRLIPFRRSIDDAFMLEFGDLTVRVWQADGSPLMNGMAQVTFPSPYAEADLPALRFKQVVDVIYIRSSTGLAPRTLERLSNISWAFNLESFTNGPWRPENADNAFTVATDHVMVGSVTNLVASKPLFDPAMVGTSFRLRGRVNGLGIGSWAPSADIGANNYLAISVGRIYRITSSTILASKIDTGNNPPIHDRGSASDGLATWEYVHDGAGIVQITAVTDATHAAGTILATLPTEGNILDGVDLNLPCLQVGSDPALPATPFWAEAAYSDFRGWPRMWPTVQEERLVGGSTAGNPDIIDLTEIAGFYPTTESYRPGLGTGLVIDTDALRRRLGDDGGQLLWSHVATFLIAGSASGEYIISGGLFGEPMTPSTVVARPLSAYGSEDVYPAKAGKGLFFVALGGQTIRRLAVDLQQNLQADDMTFLATHIAGRQFKQLAWLPQPDYVLWARLADGGLAAMTDHEEQQVRGWSRQTLGGGSVAPGAQPWTCEDMVTLPGPGRLETLWLIVSRAKGGATQRQIWQQSQVSDALYMDGAALYEGAPATTIAGLDHYDGEIVRVLADGVQVDGLEVVGGEIVLPKAASKVLVGLAFQTYFKSLKLDTGTLGGALNLRQRVAQIITRLKTALARVGIVIAGQTPGPSEQVSSRTAQNIPGAASQQIIDQATAAGGTSRDPRIIVTEDTAYDHVVYSLRPAVEVGGG